LETGASIKAVRVGLESVGSSRVFIFKTKLTNWVLSTDKKNGLSKLVPRHGDMPTVAWATELANTALVFFAYTEILPKQDSFWSCPKLE
jgi:hypothetical protein